MQETKTIAVVRMLLPKLTQPRVALLIPKVGEDAVDERMEMGLLVPVCLHVPDTLARFGIRS